MISLYDIGNTAFDRNGDVILTPTEAKVKMVAGGNWDLTLTHPMDPEGKWAHLVPGAVIKTPVPKEEIANAYAGLEADVYKTTEKTELREGPSAPTTITYPAWSISASYSVGSKVSHNGHNYQCTYFDETSAWASIAPSGCSWWTEIARTSAGSPALVTLAPGAELYFIEDYDTTWAKMTTPYGIEGYVLKAMIQYDKHLTPSETKPRIITEQLTRITNVSVDSKGRTVTVTAQHISYDLNGVIIKEVSLSQASPAMAIGRIADNFMIEYPGTIATNLGTDTNQTYTNDIKGKTGMFCLLDPDKGIASVFDAELRRDNWDLFVMQRENTDRGFRIRYRKNMLGVNWTQKSDGLINRVVPIAKAEGGEDLYLPETWIDSPLIDSYPVIRMETLSVKGQVGKEKEEGGGDVWTEADLLEEMRTKAAERFSVDKVDLVIHEVTVDFAMLGSTEEYPGLKDLESILLYDRVGVTDEEIGLDTMLTVTEMEWDAIKEKILSAKLSNANEKAGKNITGYNVKAKSIGPEKLTDEVASQILESVTGIIPEYADPEAARPSSDVSVYDGLDSSSTTAALSANQGKILNDTKASGVVVGSVESGTSKSFTISNNSRMVWFISGINTTLPSIFTVAVNSGGTVTIGEISVGSNITLTKATRTLTIANGSTSQARIMALIMAGTIS